MYRSYSLAIFYFALFAFLLLGSGALLFYSKIGFSLVNISSYYLGDTAAFTQAKSSYGLLEVALPHYGAMGLFIMVTTHFFLFGDKHRKRHFARIAIALFIAAFVDIGSGFMIVKGFEMFVGLKLLSFLALELLGLYLAFSLLRLSYKGL